MTLIKLRHCGAWQKHDDHEWWRPMVFWQTRHHCPGNSAYGIPQKVTVGEGQQL